MPDLGPKDALLGVLFLIFIVYRANSIKRKHYVLNNQPHYKYYAWNIYFKLILSITYGAIYMFYYEGGDTMAYYKAGEALNNLFWESPILFWEELINEPVYSGIYSNYNAATTGIPPGWIYKDPNSFFVSKIIACFMIFFGQSYLVLTMIFSYILSLASWKIFELVRHYKVTSDGYAALSILFIPSVSFWCAGISKDTVILIATFYLLYFAFGMANRIVTSKFKGLFFIFVFAYILYHTRTFMLFTIIAPFIIGMSTRLIAKYRDSILLVNAMRFFIIVLGFGSFFIFLRNQGEEFAKLSNQYMAEASVQTDDFLHNKTYGEKRYDLGITSYTPFGMLRVAPQAILTAFYRPGIWEASSALLMISGLETTLFIFLSLLFLFKGKVYSKIKIIRNNEFLIFSFFFALILAFFSGFTSVLFGVLVRIKAPLLPFLIIVISTKSKSKNEKLVEIENPINENTDPKFID
jgi:hypothetical protein